ncbi:MAG: AAA family ATPase [Hellea sp.]
MMQTSKVTYQQLLSLVPNVQNKSVQWKQIWSLWPELPALDSCPQDPIHHAEGDVGLHTRMVVEALIAQPDWQGLSEDDRAMLFWAAVLHDIGKPATTQREDDGRISARHHARVGTKMARGLLWEAGAPFAWREGLCDIVSEHLLPFWLIEKQDHQRLAILTSWRCRPDFLCLHATADTLGRICADQQGVLDNIALAREVFSEQGCLSKPYGFANAQSRMAYFDKPDRDPNYAAYEDFRCNVTVMAGLPGAGKDTWIAANRPDLPVVSLDNIRDEIGAPRTGNQGRVIQAAREKARVYLRAGQDFVWNATNVTRQMREKSFRLLLDYNAKIEIAYIEVSPDKLFAQNRQRPSAIPEAALRGLLHKLEPPKAWEAHELIEVVR